MGLFGVEDDAGGSLTEMKDTGRGYVLGEDDDEGFLPNQVLYLAGMKDVSTSIPRPQERVRKTILMEDDMKLMEDDKKDNL